MADFDLTQTDAQVQSILNDAQDAMGAGAQTSLTTDYIMLKDTSGNYHKILKDSFTEACRNVLAGLLVNNDKGTTISQIAAIASGDFGSITPANLASVLGANKWKQKLAVAETLDVYVGNQAAFLIQSNSGTCIVGVQPNNPYQRVIGNNDTGLTFARGTNWQHLVITNASSGELEVTIYRII